MTKPAFEKETSKQLAERETCLLSAMEQVLSRTSINAEALRQMQTAELKSKLVLAYESIPFYRHKYTAAGFHPDQFHDLNDLPKIPLVTKADLRNSDLSLRTLSEVPGGMRILSSSGSTGVPSHLSKSNASLWYFTARNMLLYYAWCGGKPIDRVLYFLDLAHDAIDCALADLLRTTVMEERIISIAEPVSALVNKLNIFKPEFVSSYPSTLRLIALELLRLKTPCQSLRLLHLTSEMLDGGTRKLLGRAFPNARILDTYTSTEAGLMAYPCQCGRMHFAEDGAIFEIVDAHGHPTHDMGEIVVTDLTNAAGPLIRYQGLGDFCKWEHSACACGSAYRSYSHLEGRVVDSILLADGSAVSPYCAANALEDVEGLCQFQIIQRQAGRVQILAIKDQASPLSDEHIQRAINAAIQAASNGLLESETRFVERISPGRGRHKVPLVISEIARPA